MSDVKKVVLAYSGGLDTSVIVKWLKEEYKCEVIAYAADVGQEEELQGLEEKAMKTGASKVYIEDLREEFAKDFIFFAIKAMNLNQLIGAQFSQLGVANNFFQFLVQKLKAFGPINAGGDGGEAEFEKWPEILFQGLFPCAVKIGWGHFLQKVTKRTKGGWGSFL